MRPPLPRPSSRRKPPPPLERNRARIWGPGSGEPGPFLLLVSRIVLERLLVRLLTGSRSRWLRLFTARPQKQILDLRRAPRTERTTLDPERDIPEGQFAVQRTGGRKALVQCFEVLEDRSDVPTSHATAHADGQMGAHRSPLRRPFSVNVGNSQPTPAGPDSDPSRKFKSRNG